MVLPSDATGGHGRGATLSIGSYATVGHGSGIFLPIYSTSNAEHIMYPIDYGTSNGARVKEPPCDHTVLGLHVLDNVVWDLCAPRGRLGCAPRGRLGAIALFSGPWEQCRTPSCDRHCVVPVLLFVRFWVFRR